MDHGENRRQVALPGSHEEQSVDGAVGSQPWPHHPDIDGRYLELGSLSATVGGARPLPRHRTSCANKDRNLGLHLTSSPP